MESKYRQLAKMIDEHPVGAPNSKEFMQILEILYPPVELEMALLLSFRPQKLEDVAEAAGISAEETAKILEAMAAKGTILGKTSKGVRVYRLWPILAGFYEYTTMSDRFDADTRDKLKKLWHYYYKKDFVHELGETEPPWMRVLPAQSALMQPDEVVPYEIASELIRNKSKSIAVGKCACRVVEQHCDKPTETCLGFDEAADFMIEYGMGRKISVEEALAVLKMCEEAGLVHMNSNNKNNLLFICNCCPDCCHLFRPYTEFNYLHTIGKSSFQAEIEDDLCTGCAICVEDRCPVAGALKMVDEIAVTNSVLCIGCGLCVTACPTEAISLVKRAETPHVPETLFELSQEAAKTKRANRANPNYIR